MDHEIKCDRKRLYSEMNCVTRSRFRSTRCRFGCLVFFLPSLLKEVTFRRSRHSKTYQKRPIYILDVPRNRKRQSIPIAIPKESIGWIALRYESQLLSRLDRSLLKNPLRKYSNDASLSRSRIRGLESAANRKTVELLPRPTFVTSESRPIARSYRLIASVS